ncbi:hypothetical protein D187_008720 [Cystobacter fuscus DSM 2262]|uniref:Uncharacterized protein n=1 Tax=Cystobacter fuscus (strain ATCC 25194 / DSM 2262 / NBRC 100088 / M29) TaxID=1242864 RepID=S9PJE2_CYSF2|nr:hypothetical protein [Cystobacter fuscus]EPX62532.1 hypothetical protein D187_008720 [Cystobacter fuscus DSM 2262]
MQQPQKPSLGRVVLFVDERGDEHAADVVKVDPRWCGEIRLHVKTTDPAQPILVESAPFQEGVKDARGRSWRWPPRV